MTRTMSARPGLVAAFAAVSACIAVDASATGSGPNPGLAARVETLERQNARQQAQIRQLKRRPNLAGKSCPEGLAVVGFEANGALKCAAPWTTTEPPPDPQTTFSCVENHDAAAVAAALKDFLEGNVMSSLRRVQLSQSGSVDVGGLSFSYGVNGKVWTTDGLFTVQAPLVEIAAQEPCADAVRVTIQVPDFSIDGEAELDFGSLGFFTQDTDIVASSVVLEVLVRLRAPEIAGLPAGASLARDAETVSLTMVSGDIDLELEGGLGAIFEPALEFVADSYISRIRDEFLGVIEDDLGMQLLSTLSAPVTVVVVAVP